MKKLLRDDQLIEQNLNHIDNKTPDVGTEVRRGPAIKIQETVNALRNPHFIFGLFEMVIVHFHQNLEKRL